MWIETSPQYCKPLGILWDLHIRQNPKKLLLCHLCPFYCNKRLNQLRHAFLVSLGVVSLVFFRFTASLIHLCDSKLVGWLDEIQLFPCRTGTKKTMWSYLILVVDTFLFSLSGNGFEWFMFGYLERVVNTMCCIFRLLLGPVVVSLELAMGNVRWCHFANGFALFGIKTIWLS